MQMLAPAIMEIVWLLNEKNVLKMLIAISYYYVNSFFSIYRILYQRVQKLNIKLS